jgi:hypothetical protein
VKISTDKMKAIAMEGRQIRRVKTVINGKLIEQVNSFKSRMQYSNTQDEYGSGEQH